MSRADGGSLFSDEVVRKWAETLSKPSPLGAMIHAPAKTYRLAEWAYWKYGTMIQHESGVRAMYIGRNALSQTHSMLVMHKVFAGASGVQTIPDSLIGLWHSFVET